MRTFNGMTEAEARQLVLEVQEHFEALPDDSVMPATRDIHDRADAASVVFAGRVVEALRPGGFVNHKDYVRGDLISSHPIL